ncbi:MAG: RNase adapter RapZ [Finegoldia sp.]|nr:RNase adapter RapZ [Finegoldia sp.]
MKVVIITGMSGAGKSAASNVFEDIGYYTLDNLPPSLIVNFIDLIKDKDNDIKKIACVIDNREEFSNQLSQTVNKINDMGVDVSLLYLDASNSALIKRYKENRRPHPFASNGTIIQGIERERKLLEDLKGKADHVIDTSGLSLGELGNIIKGYYDNEGNSLNISVISFGYKRGILLDADLVFDVRFLPNPYYIDDLKPKSGLEKEVKDYVLKFDETNEFIDKIADLLEFLIPYYKKEGKVFLIIGIGCTGGKHRSVFIANQLADILSEKGEKVNVSHRDRKYW